MKKAQYEIQQQPAADRKYIQLLKWFQIYNQVMSLK